MNFIGNRKQIINCNLILILFIIVICGNISMSSQFLDSVFALSNNKIVLIRSLSTNPSVVTVGKSFGIHAVILNNSSHPITFNAGCNSSPLTALFNKNVQIIQMANCGTIIPVTIKNGEKIDIQSPSTFEIFLAISPGKTIANMTFQYNGGYVDDKLLFFITQGIANTK